jgi:hypothetical protein
MMKFPIYGKIKNVPNHQPDNESWVDITPWPKIKPFNYPSTAEFPEVCTWRFTPTLSINVNSFTPTLSINVNSLVVLTILKNMSSSMGRIIPYIMEIYGI